jgi:CRP-like cAMP-binding protein
MTTEASFDPAIFLAKAGEGQTVTEHAKGQIIFSQGEAAEAVYYILHGDVKLTVVSEQGREAVVAFLGANDFFGESCLSGQKVRISSAIAMTESSVACINKAAMRKLLLTEPALSETFIAYLLARTIRVEADLVDQLFNSSEKRLARLLLILANFGEDGNSKRRTAKISQETLADMIGTTRSRVSFFMNKFRKLGFIDYNNDSNQAGGIEVHKSLLNLVLHDQPHIDSHEQSIGVPPPKQTRPRPR